MDIGSFKASATVMGESRAIDCVVTGWPDLSFLHACFVAGCATAKARLSSGPYCSQAVLKALRKASFCYWSYCVRPRPRQIRNVPVRRGRRRFANYRLTGKFGRKSPDQNCRGSVVTRISIICCSDSPEFRCRPTLLPWYLEQLLPPYPLLPGSWRRR